jgi:hypothetical protein
LHFDNAPLHNATAVLERLTDYGFFRLAHHPYSQDLSLGNFLLFGHLQETWKHTSYSARDQLETVIVGMIDAIPRTVLSGVSQSWRERLVEYIKRSRDDFE